MLLFLLYIITVNSIRVNDFMSSTGYAKRYDGNTMEIIYGPVTNNILSCLTPDTQRDTMEIQWK